MLKFIFYLVLTYIIYFFLKYVLNLYKKNKNNNSGVKQSRDNTQKNEETNIIDKKKIIDADFEEIK